MKLKGVLGKFSDTYKKEDKEINKKIKKEISNETYLQYIQRVARKYGW